MKILFFFLFINIIIEPFLFSQPNHYIDYDFPGGNIDIEKITPDTIWLNPDHRDTEGSWFYWNFKVRNAQGKKIVFCFKDKNVFTDFGPAFSKDGKNWTWFGDKNFSENSFSFRFEKTDSVIQFCTSIPYTEKDLEMFLHQQNSELLHSGVLCKSRHGRNVEQIIV